MTMTPQDIQKQKFKVKFRGYDENEVDSYLEKVAQDFLELIKKSKELGLQVDELTKDKDALLSEEKSFKVAMLSAQKVADEIKAKSKQDSEARLKETNEKIEQLTYEANTNIAKLKAEIEELENMKAAVRKELNATLQLYMDRLGSEVKTEKKGETTKAVVPPVTAKAAAVKKAAKVKAKKADEKDLSEEDVADLYQKVDVPDKNKDAVTKKAPAEAEGFDDDSDTFEFPDDDEDEVDSMPGTNKGDLGEDDLMDLFQETDETRARFEEAPDPFAKGVEDDSDIFEFPDDDEEEVKGKKN